MGFPVNFPRVAAFWRHMTITPLAQEKTFLRLYFDVRERSKSRVHSFHSFHSFHYIPCVPLHSIRSTTFHSLHSFHSFHSFHSIPLHSTTFHSIPFVPFTIYIQYHQSYPYIHQPPSEVQRVQRRTTHHVRGISARHAQQPIAADPKDVGRLRAQRGTLDTIQRWFKHLWTKLPNVSSQHIMIQTPWIHVVMAIYYFTFNISFKVLE